MTREKSRFVPGAYVFLLFALLGLGVWQTSLLRSLETRLVDGQFAYLRVHHPRALAQDVVVIGIDEETFLRFPEPYALWHQHIGDVLKAASDAGASHVALDIVLPEKSFDFVQPGIDAKLLGALAYARGRISVVVGQTVDETGKLRPLYAPIASLAGGPAAAGLVLVEPDPDGVVRQYGSPTGAPPSLAARLAGVDLRGAVDYSIGDNLLYLPLHRVLEWYRSGDTHALANAFHGRTVIVGSVLPFSDRHYLPVHLAGWEKESLYQPGVLIHAQALRTYLTAGSLLHPADTLLTGILIVLAAGFWFAGKRPRAGALGLIVFGAMVTTASTWMLYSQHALLPSVVIIASGAMALVSRAAVVTAGNLIERNRLRSVFGRYVSPGVLSQIVAGKLAPGLGGTRQEICVLFSDVRGFTTISEKASPEEVIGLLNRYFQHMADAIHAQNGTIDKFMGDGIMAFFGAPNAMDNPCEAGFRAARDMLQRLEVLNSELNAEGVRPVQIGIGLHVGQAVVGHVGSRERHEYTAIGDVVNTASRLEGLTKDAGYRVLCSEPVRERLERRSEFVALGERPIKGRSAIHVFGWDLSNEGK